MKKNAFYNIFIFILFNFLIFISSSFNICHAFDGYNLVTSYSVGGNDNGSSPDWNNKGGFVRADRFAGPENGEWRATASGGSWYGHWYDINIPSDCSYYWFVNTRIIDFGQAYSNTNYRLNVNYGNGTDNNATANVYVSRDNVNWNYATTLTMPYGGGTSPYIEIPQNVFPAQGIRYVKVQIASGRTVDCVSVEVWHLNDTIAPTYSSLTSDYTYTNNPNGTFRVYTHGINDTGGAGIQNVNYWAIKEGVESWNQSGTTAQSPGVFYIGNTDNYCDIPKRGDGTYLIHAHPYDNSGNWNWNSLDLRVIVDTVKPMFSSAEIKNVTNDGYDVYVYNVSDDRSGVDRVQFPTWTDNNGQDDIISDWWTNPKSTGTNLGNGTWVYHVNRSDHKNEFGKYSTHVYVYDKAGNYYALAFSATLDTTSPTSPAIIPSILNWTNQNVVINITSGTDNESGVNRTEYTINNGTTWNTYSSPFSITNEGITTVLARTIDNVGNISNTSSSAVKIDRTVPTAPTINPSTTNWTNNNVTFTITNGMDSLSGVQKSQYQINGGTWIDYSSTVTISNEGIHTINARTIDNANNISSNTSTQVKIDRKVPTAPTINPSTTNWTNEDVMFIITPGTDNGSGQSGIDSTQYQVDGGTWNCFYHGGDSSSYNTIVGTVSNEGTHVINTKTIDKGGNTSSITTTTVKIDRTVPTAPTINPSTVNWTNGNVTFTVNNGTDSLSGVAYSQYQIDGGAWTNYGSAVTVSTEGVHTINAKTIDNAGNVSSIATTTIKIDKTIPAAPTITGNIPNGQWINVANFSFSISGGSDSSSGISYYQYQLDGGAWTKYNGTVTITNEGYHNVYARAVDNAGNISSPTGIYQIGIDRTIPTTPTITPSTTNWTNSNVTFTITNGADSGSGIQKSQYQINGGTWIDYSSTVTISNEGVHTINAKTIDNVGNVGSIATTIIKIDKTIPAAPTITGNIPNGQWLNIANFSFSISGGSDSSSGISYYQYQLDGGAWTKYNGTVTITNEGYHSVYARAVDNAGNISSPTGIYQIGIDRTIPTTPTITPSTTNWTNSNVTFTITNGADSGSGVKKSQYQIDGGTWTDYSSTVTISNEGVHTINARTIDNVGNISSIAAATVKIDKTISYAVINPSSYDGSKTNINYNTNPTDINLAVHLTNIKDNLSGVANIKVWFTDSSTTAATLPGTYFNFDIAAGTSNKDLAVKLPSGDFNRKNIHFQIIDNAGNISHYYGGIKLEALAPKVPVLSEVTNNRLYVRGDTININWTYIDNNSPALPQDKAELIFSNVETGETITKALNDASTSYQIPASEIPDGITKLKVIVYNSDNKHSESSEIIIRINRFNPNGSIITKTIELADNIEFVSVKTDYSKPAGTNIKCTLYYWNKDSGCFDENHKLIIDNNNSFIRLPYASNKFKIKYDLSSTNTVNVLGATYAKISPYITSSRLFGK